MATMDSLRVTTDSWGELALSKRSFNGFLILSPGGALAITL